MIAIKSPVLGHVNEDHVVPEPQLFECLYRLMVAAETMDRQLRLAAGSRMSDRLCGSPRAIAGKIPPRWALDQNQCGDNTVRPSSDAMYPSFRGHGQSRLPDTRPHFRTAPYTSIGGWQLDACLSKFPVMMQYVAAI